MDGDEQPRYYSNCGTRLPGDVGFCPNCGTRVSEPDSARRITQGRTLAGETAYWVSRGYSIQLQTDKEALLGTSWGHSRRYWLRSVVRRRPRAAKSPNETGLLALGGTGRDVA